MGSHELFMAYGWADFSLQLCEAHFPFHLPFLVGKPGHLPAGFHEQGINS